MMKYLYRILRLFRCPHKFKVEFSRDIEFKEEDQYGTVVREDTYRRYVNRCVRCGKMENHNERKPLL